MKYIFILVANISTGISQFTPFRGYRKCISKLDNLIFHNLCFLYSLDVFPNNYELKLIERRTDVRLYDCRIHHLHGFPNNYALRIMNYELFSASLHTLHSLDRLDLFDHIVHLLKIVDEQ